MWGERQGVAICSQTRHGRIRERISRYKSLSMENSEKPHIDVDDTYFKTIRIEVRQLLY